MRQVKVGTYQARFSEIEVYLREGTGGEFYTYPESGRLPRIKIGAYSPKEWRKVVEVTLHEVFEFGLLSLGARFTPNPLETDDHAGYLFVFDHFKFSELCSGAGYILTDLIPDLAKAFKEFHKPVKKK